MRRRQRFAASGLGIGLLAAAAAFLVVGASSFASGSVVSGSGESGQTPSAQAAASVFKIAGHDKGLYPGATVPLILTVTNPQTYAITVTSIKTDVHQPLTTCASTYLTVSLFSGSVQIPAGQHTTVKVFATLSHHAPNACQGTLFPLQYAGLGTRP